jgi:hypothetical protein
MVEATTIKISLLETANRMELGDVWLVISFVEPKQRQTYLLIGIKIINLFPHTE